MRTLAWCYMAVAFLCFLAGFASWLFDWGPKAILCFAFLGMIWLWFSKSIWEDAEEADRRKTTLTFGFRRISPDGERWEWWDGQRWKSYHSFALHVNVHHHPEMTLKESIELCERKYQLTKQHPSKPCKQFHEEGN